MKILNYFSINVLGFIIPSFVGFLSIIYIQRVVPLEIFTLLSFIWTILTIFGISDLGFSRISARESAAYRLNKVELEHARNSMSSIVVISLGFSILVFLIMIALIAFILSDSISKDYLYFLSCAVPIFILNSVFRGVSEGNDDFYFVNLAKISFSILVFIIPILQYLVFNEVDILRYLIAIIVIRIIIMSMFYIRNINLLKGILKLANKDTFNFSYMIESPALAFGGILGSFCVFIERGIFESAFVEYYAAFFLAHEIIMKVWIMPSAMSLTLFPTLANFNNASSKQEITKYVPYIFLLSMVLLIAIPMIIYLLIYQINMGEIITKNFYLFYCFMGIGVLIGALAQTFNIYLLSARAYKFIISYSSIIFILYVPILLIFGKLSIIYFFIVWNIRYLVDFIFILIKFKQK